MDRIKKLKIKKQDGTFSDYIPIGADAENIDFENGYSLDEIIGDINPDEDGTLEVQLNKTVKYYDTVAQMIADSSIKVGNLCKTLGYYAIGDNGAANYNIVETSTSNRPGEFIELANGLFAQLLIDESMNIKQFGFNEKDTSTNITAWLNNFYSNYADLSIYFKNLDFTINGTVTINNSNLDIYLTNCNITNETTTNQRYIFKTNNKDNINFIGKNTTLKFNKPATTQQACFSLYRGKNIYVKGFTLKDAGGDGIIIAGANMNGKIENVTIEDCVIDNVRRNGISIVGGTYNTTLRNIKISNTDGALPQYAIDIESWQDNVYDEKILIEKCIFDGSNAGGGIDIMSWINDLTIKDCIFQNGDGISEHGIYSSGENSYPKKVKILNNTFSNAGCYFAGARWLELLFEGNKFYNDGLSESPYSNFTFDADGGSGVPSVTSTSPSSVGTIKIINNHWIKGNCALSMIQNVLFSGNTIYNGGLETLQLVNADISKNQFIDYNISRINTARSQAIKLQTTHRTIIHDNYFECNIDEGSTIPTRVIYAASNNTIVSIYNNLSHNDTDIANFFYCEGSTAKIRQSNNRMDKYYSAPWQAMTAADELQSGTILQRMHNGHMETYVCVYDNTQSKYIWKALHNS